MPFARIGEMDFTSAEKKFTVLLTSTDEQKRAVICPLYKLHLEKILSQPQMILIEAFYSTLSKVDGVKPIILSLVPDYFEAYVPLQTRETLVILHMIYNEEFIVVALPRALKKRGDICLSPSITPAHDL